MHSTHLRKEHIEGLLVGVAAGDALGLPRKGLSRRAALASYGRPRLKYRCLPLRGMYSDDTQLMLMSAQAILNSRSDARCFRSALRARLAWFLLSFPVGVSKPTLLAAAKCWLSWAKLPSGVNSAGSDPATRAMFCALALNGTGNRIFKWVEDSTRLTHTHPLTVDGCKVLAQLASVAATTKLESLAPVEALNEVIATSSEAELRDYLERLLPFLEARRSSSYVARQFGWDRGISNYIVPTTVMATYCWLRNPSDYSRAVASAIRLGGNSDTLAAIVGGLVGAHIGVSALPPELTQGLGGYPHGAAWMVKLSERFSHWPHGSEDLHIAPGLPSNPIMQVLRNLFALAPILLHRLTRRSCAFFKCSR
jgi:ADP-ribosyl-[dinitrogen reductase] hydrolase